MIRKGFPGDSVVKNLPANAGDMGLIPGLKRLPGEGNGNALQCSCLGNPMGREAKNKNPPSYFFSSLPSCLCSPIPNLLTFFPLSPLFLPFSLLKLALRIG